MRSSAICGNLEKHVVFRITAEANSPDDANRFG
jgi:hypothetical protein